MLRTVRAMIDKYGHVRLLEQVHLDEERFALVTIMENGAADEANITALLSEPALTDWNRPEEDAAWQHLQSEASS
jgi:hypothetical protein